MAVNVEYVVTPYADEASVPLSLSSGDNRALVALTYHVRNPPNISLVSPRMDGVAATIIAETVLGGRIMQLAIWMDAELPASPGSYTLSWPVSTVGLVSSLLECTNVQQAFPLRDSYDSLTDYPSGRTLSATTLALTEMNSETGDLMVGAFYQTAGTQTIGGTGVTTVLEAGTSNARMYGVDGGGHALDLSPVKNAGVAYYALAAIRSADGLAAVVARRMLTLGVG